MNAQTQSTKRKQIAASMGAGITLGIALGAALGEIALGLALGTLIGGAGALWRLRAARGK